MNERSPTTRSTGPPTCSRSRSRTLVRSCTSHPVVLPEPPGQLAVADVDRDHLAGALAQQDVGEPAGRGPGVEAAPARDTTSPRARTRPARRPACGHRARRTPRRPGSPGPPPPRGPRRWSRRSPAWWRSRPTPSPGRRRSAPRRGRASAPARGVPARRRACRRRGATGYAGSPGSASRADRRDSCARSNAARCSSSGASSSASTSAEHLVHRRHPGARRLLRSDGLGGRRPRSGSRSSGACRRHLLGHGRRLPRVGVPAGSGQVRHVDRVAGLVEVGPARPRRPPPTTVRVPRRPRRRAGRPSHRRRPSARRHRPSSSGAAQPGRPSARQVVPDPGGPLRPDAPRPGRPERSPRSSPATSRCRPCAHRRCRCAGCRRPSAAGRPPPAAGSRRAAVAPACPPPRG